MVDSRTIIEQNRSVLDGSDFSGVGKPTESTTGMIGRLIIAKDAWREGIGIFKGIEKMKESSTQINNDLVETSVDQVSKGTLIPILHCWNLSMGHKKKKWWLIWKS